MDELEKLFALFDAPDAIDVVTNCCNQPDHEYINSFKTCINCGTMDANDKQPYYDPYDERLVIKHNIPYKRVAYLKQKLMLLGCFKMYPVDNILIRFIAETKDKNVAIASLSSLKKMMTNKKLNKYYKYIYSIYLGITGTKLINISRSDIKALANLFVQFEKSFNSVVDRKYIYSYNVIICILLKQLKIKNYNKMLLPINNYKIKKLIRIWINLTNCQALAPF